MKISGFVKIVVLVIAGNLSAQEYIPSPPPFTPPPTTLNDTALFLAGLPVHPESPLRFLQSSPISAQHASELNAAFDLVERHRLKPMRTWAKTQIQPRIPRPTTIFYLFGGPDFLSVTSIFAEAQTYVLAGLEPVGQVADLLTMEPQVLDESLANLRFGLRSVLEKGFFETREMREDLQRTSVRGVLPMLYVFLTRTGHVLVDMAPIALDAEGNAQRVDATEAIGVEIGFTSALGGPRQTLFYFCTDVSDGALAKNDRFLKLLNRMGEGGSYLKAASYLLHGKSFDKIRAALLNQSRYILQDDSGIPLRFLQDGRWDLTFFGNYAGPMDIFREYEQPEMWRAFSNRDIVQPLPFGTGYRRDDRESNQVFALRRASQTTLPPAYVPY